MFASLSELFFPSCSRTSQFLHYLPTFTGKTAIFLRNWEIWFWNEIKQLLVETNLIFLQFMTLFFRAVSVYIIFTGQVFSSPFPNDWHTQSQMS